MPDKGSKDSKGDPGQARVDGKPGTQARAVAPTGRASRAAAADASAAERRAVHSPAPTATAGSRQEMKA